MIVMKVNFEFCVMPVSAPACFAQQRSLKERGGSELVVQVGVSHPLGKSCRTWIWYIEGKKIETSR